MPTPDIRAIAPDQTYPLRSLVLRPGQPMYACQWPGDNDPGSFHAGAFLDRELVAIASVILQAMPDCDQTRAGRHRSFRLRGMATHPGYRGQGLGSALLRYCIERTRDAGGDLLWCNARTPAVEFYRRAGFESVGEEFETPDIGPHVRMQLDLSVDPARRSNT